MKALLDAMQFKQIMDGCKHAVSTDNSRPILGYIKLDIKGETITAYACDGFRLAKVVVTNTVHAASNKEEFIAYIKPLTVPKQTVDMIFPIEISKDDNIVSQKRKVHIQVLSAPPRLYRRREQSGQKIPAPKLGRQLGIQRGKQE